MTLPGERGIHPARARERQWRCRALPEWPTALKFAGELPWDRLLDLPSAEMSLQPGWRHTPDHPARWRLPGASAAAAIEHAPRSGRRIRIGRHKLPRFNGTLNTPRLLDDSADPRPLDCPAILPWGWR